MTKNKIKLIHTVFAIVLAALALIVAVLFIAGCLDIYQSGSRPFSRESVAAHFRMIAIPVYLFIVSVIAGGILSLVLPFEDKKKKGVHHTGAELQRVNKKLANRPLAEKDRVSIACWNRARRILLAVTVCLLLLGVLVSCLYLFKEEHFPAENINREVLNAFAVTLLSLLPSLLCMIAHLTVSRRCLSICRSALKKSYSSDISAETALSVKSTESKEEESLVAKPLCRHLLRLRARCRTQGRVLSLTIKCLFVTLGILFVILGIRNGGAYDVVQKAIKICTECIGLG